MRKKDIDAIPRRLHVSSVMTPNEAPSLEAAARRPLLGPLAAITALLGALAVAIACMEGFARHVLGAYSAPSLHVAVFFVAFDLATGSVLLLGAWRRLEADHRAASTVHGDASGSLSGTAPPLSVLIAAYNEASPDEQHGVVATVRALAGQTGVEFEVLVGDDGSTDGTFDEVVRAFSLRPAYEGATTIQQGTVARLDGGAVPLRVFRLPHSGKGATLNSLARHASHGVLVTMDADTAPATGALVALASAFVDPDVESAAGVVSVRNARSILTRHQYAEYVKNSIVRIGWSALGALEQVPGAFAGVRASSFEAVGGFPVDSLTEDYELTYRLVDRGLAIGRVPVVVTVPGAQAFTDVPVTFRGFLRQRTRWFAGFLSTLFRFRHLIARPGTGGFGLVRLPLKLVDAVLPLIAFASLIVLVRGASSSVLSLSRVAVGIFLVRWVWDLTFYAFALRLARGMGDPVATARVAPEGWRGWLCTASEALTYVWLKHAAVLRAYLWAGRKVQTWEPSREAASGAPPSEGSPQALSTVVRSPQCAPPSVHS